MLQLTESNLYHTPRYWNTRSYNSGFYYNVEASPLLKLAPINYKLGLGVVFCGGYKTFIEKVIESHYYGFETVIVRWDKLQTINNVREKSLYVLFDNGLIYYHPNKEILGCVKIIENTLLFVLSTKLVILEKSLLKIGEYKTERKDIQVIISSDFKVTKRFIEKKIELEDYENFMIMLESHKINSNNI